MRNKGKRFRIVVPFDRILIGVYGGHCTWMIDVQSVVCPSRHRRLLFLSRPTYTW
jgi:hypothetical protein